MEENTTSNEPNENHLHNVTALDGMYQNWFLDYASYVILERAVPSIEDGLKPVQRRILHSMWELEDGRYNKVANVIGHTMKYHPHGDASIGDAIVQIGQKDLLIDTQGNWGNILTGDSAAAPRYIEMRLTPFALDVLYNPKTTHWGLSYDGRNKEPLNLPVKFPILLAHGVEGIAVGMACKILPHNFNELVDASIEVLKGRKTNVLPDFPTAGQADFSDYREGLRGGRIKIRAKINMLDKKTLQITEIPFGTTTQSLIDSIVAANEKEKVKIRKIEDNTAENVDILIHLPPNISPDKTIDALYAFTDCQLSISPNAAVIINDKPRFINVNEILKISAFQTRDLLQRELEILLSELNEAWHFSSLEKIFIKEEMYIDFKKYNNKESLYTYLYERFQPFKKKLLREIKDEDLHKLTQIPMIRITRFDSAKAEDHMKELDRKIDETKAHLSNITNYTIDYFKELKRKYGKGKERKTEIKNFDNIAAVNVAIANEKLYWNKKEGFAGIALKRDDKAEMVGECSQYDDMIVFREDGTMQIMKVADKTFVGENVIHLDVFKKNDERTTYNLVYQDGPKGFTYMKRFNVTGIIRDKEYHITKGTPDSKMLWFSANANGEAEILTIHLKPLPKVRKLQFDIDLSQLEIKGRGTMGNLVSKFPVRKIVLKEKLGSTLGATKVWFDDVINRINTDGHGTYLGEFNNEDRILCVSQSGTYRLVPFDISLHFEDDLILVEKFFPQLPLSVIYLDGPSKNFFVKRFVPEVSTNKVTIIPEGDGSYIELATTQSAPTVELIFTKDKGKEIPKEQIKLVEFIEIRNLKAKGSKITDKKVKEVNLLLPEVVESDDHDEFEEDGLSPLQALKQKANPGVELPKDPDEDNQIKMKF
jgi:topoisomerase-4 subunit A